MATQNASRRVRAGARRKVHNDALPAAPIAEDKAEFRLQGFVSGRAKLEFDRLRLEKGASESAFVREIVYDFLARARAAASNKDT